MKCQFSRSAHNVAMVTLRICYFFDYLPFLLILLYTDESSNASAFVKQLYTVSIDFISSPEPQAQDELLPLANVRRASSVVRRKHFTLNNISSETAGPRALIFGM